MGDSDGTVITLTRVQTAADLSTPTTKPGEPILVATGVRKTYSTGAETVDALKGVDLAVQQGEFLAVMGPSGSGKTTLLNCLSGLDDIDAGQVVVGGHDIQAMSDA